MSGNQIAGEEDDTHEGLEWSEYWKSIATTRLWKFFSFKKEDCAN